MPSNQGFASIRLLTKGTLMKKRFRTFVSIFTAAFLLLMGGCSGCSNDKNTAAKTPPPKPVHIVVILDTSDRVSNARNPHQIERDLAITKAIVHLFEEKLVHPKRYIGSKDTLTFSVPEQPGIAPPPQTGNTLKIGRSPGERSVRAPQFREKKIALLKTIDGLYEHIGQQDEFTGSDIWLWFRDSVELYLRPDARNYIICISDGYLDFNRSIQRQRTRGTYMSYRQVSELRDTPNWRQRFHDDNLGLLEIGQNFSDYDVKFLMVEITHRHILDLEIVKEYWQTWLTSMGITDSQFLPAQPTSKATIERIAEFISDR